MKLPKLYTSLFFSFLLCNTSVIGGSLLYPLTNQPSVALNSYQGNSSTNTFLNQNNNTFVSDAGDLTLSALSTAVVSPLASNRALVGMSPNSSIKVLNGVGLQVEGGLLYISSNNSVSVKLGGLSLDLAPNTQVIVSNDKLLVVRGFIESNELNSQQTQSGSLLSYSNFNLEYMNSLDSEQISNYRKIFKNITNSVNGSTSNLELVNI